MPAASEALFDSLSRPGNGVAVDYLFGRAGIDVAVPDTVLKMPDCDTRDPSVIPHDAMPNLKLAPTTKSVSVELTYRDGSASEIKTFRR